MIVDFGSVVQTMEPSRDMKTQHSTTESFDKHREHH